jgi:hypothetical protein
MKCQEIISPHGNAISIYKNQNGSIKASAVCAICHNKATRFYKKEQQAQLEKTFIINEPLLVTKAGSVRLGIACALVAYEEKDVPAYAERGENTVRKQLRRNQLLTRDARRLERKKVCLGKARRATQFSKR